MFLIFTNTRVSAQYIIRYDNWSRISQFKRSNRTMRHYSWIINKMDCHENYSNAFLMVKVFFSAHSTTHFRLFILVSYIKLVAYFFIGTLTILCVCVIFYYLQFSCSLLFLFIYVCANGTRKYVFFFRQVTCFLLPRDLVRTNMRNEHYNAYHRIVFWAEMCASAISRSGGWLHPMNLYVFSLLELKNPTAMTLRLITNHVKWWQVLQRWRQARPHQQNQPTIIIIITAATTANGDGKIGDNAVKNRKKRLENWVCSAFD